MNEMTQEARRQVVADALAAAPADAERRPMAWRGEDVSFVVVKVKATDVLLNPESHRIKAQIRSMGDKGKYLLADPFTKESQDTIADIIRATKDYAKVKSVIARDKQQHPGVITNEGVLVNANTRAVVLRDLVQELGHDEAKAFEYIKVHVLPSDASNQEITRLELSFQMQPEVRQEYTFTNRLLFIQDLLEDGFSPEQIGLEMDRSLNPDLVRDRNEAERVVKADDRIRQMVQELVEASGGALAWEDFDEQVQNLKDIEQNYQALLSKRGQDVARRVRQAKLAAMLADVPYRLVRQIDENYLDEYVVPALLEDLTLKNSAASLAYGTTSASDSTGADGLDVLDDLVGVGGFDDDATAGSGQVTLDPLFDLLVTTGRPDPDNPGSTVDVPTEDGSVVIPTEAFYASVANALATAAATKERDGQGLDALDAPRKQLVAAATACDKARKTLEAILDDGQDVDQDKLRSAYEAYQRSHDELVDYLSKKVQLDATPVP